jgi:DNA (cytosine-5)-methyltransferase 1
MAAECIDFSIPCPSIFTRKKPLADNTGNRVARGVLRFVINNPDPFVIEVPHGSLTNTDGSARARAIVLPFITRICHQGSKGANVHSVTEPLTTIVSKNEHVLIAPILVGVGGPQGAGNPQPADQPIGTIMPENHRALAVAFLTKFYGTATGSDLRQPMPSITAQAGGGHMGEVRAFLSKYDPTIHGDPALDPITVTIRGQRYVIVDIGLRMLTPRELAYAQFGWAPSLTPGGAERALAEDYIFPGTQANQISKIGNSVPPLMAAHLVAANVLPPRKAQRLLMAA